MFLRLNGKGVDFKAVKSGEVFLMIDGENHEIDRPTWRAIVAETCPDAFTGEIVDGCNAPQAAAEAEAARILDEAKVGAENLRVSAEKDAAAMKGAAQAELDEAGKKHLQAQTFLDEATRLNVEAAERLGTAIDGSETAAKAPDEGAPAPSQASS